jgi:hypothetical protein
MPDAALQGIYGYHADLGVPTGLRTEGMYGFSGSTGVLVDLEEHRCFISGIKTHS